ncbi:hypothetical protein JM16_000447 [Phytophthora kernoviae]|uniref:6,7-dimethyl-8-ribityllumazine synthase n=1 Tax=Phytophthora kernoviae TaxID=325452 RepID=A0A8T0M988_9STRA|nr:hypothetical protein JM16_000447 [Phytophthora kernoviae]
MAPPTVKDTTTLKHTVKGDRPESASHGYHSGHHGEGKTEVLHSRDEHSRVTESNKLDVKDLRVTIIASRWYEKEIRLLVEACSEELLSKGVAANNLHLFEVSGAFELPYAAARMVHCKDTSHRPDAVICIGCIVKDATLMCGTMSKAVANGIMKLNVTSDVPVIYGVLCCESESQVHTCSIERVNSGNSGEKRTYGASWAQSALEMAHLKRCASAKKAEHCHCSRCTMRGGGPGGMRTSVFILLW